jgi:predicted ATPase
MGDSMARNYISSVKLTKPLPKDSFLSNIPAVRHLILKGELPFTKPVTFLIGENGTGKSTLLEAIAVAYGFNPEGGTSNFTFSTCATHSELYQHLTLVKRAYAKDGFFLRAESFYNLASNIDDLGIEDSYGGQSLHMQSHGESFLSLVENRFSGNGLYLLDEPEAALSPSRLMTLLLNIDKLVHHGSQFIIATHSPILMAYPNAELYELSDTGINSVDYRQTDHYLLTREFLEHPEKMLHILFEK